MRALEEEDLGRALYLCRLRLVLGIGARDLSLFGGVRHYHAAHVTPRLYSWLDVIRVWFWIM